MEDLDAQRKGFASRLVPASSDTDSRGPMPLTDIETSDAFRRPTGLEGLDQVLGGGLVAGSVILLAGDPGIGKSTVLLQVAKHVASRDKVLYITGEESASQVRLRASRLGVSSADILVDAEQDVSLI